LYLFIYFSFLIVYRLDEALECLKLEIKYYNEAEGYAQIRKVVIGVILIHLYQEDFVAADHFFRDALGYVYLFFPHYCGFPN
jgi:hypothetical protein